MPVSLSGTGKKRGEVVRGGGGGGGGNTSSPTSVGSRQRVFQVLWNLERPVDLSQREICAYFNGGRKCFI